MLGISWSFKRWVNIPRTYLVHGKSRGSFKFLSRYRGRLVTGLSGFLDEFSASSSARSGRLGYLRETAIRCRVLFFLRAYVLRRDSTFSSPVFSIPSCYYQISRNIFKFCIPTKILQRFYIKFEWSKQRAG